MDKTKPHPMFKLATELGPLLIFFFVNSKVNLFVATGAFMVAVVIAMVASYIVTKHVPSWRSSPPPSSSCSAR